MKLKKDSGSIVIAGAWNQLILQPAWVIARTPDYVPGTDEPLSTQFGMGIVDDPPRFTFPGKFTFQVRRNALLMSPETPDEAGAVLVQRTAVNILRELRHTPVNGVGYNFEFEAADADPSLDQIRVAQQDIVNNADAEFTVVSNAIRTSLSNGNLLLNVQKDFQAGVLSMKFNFHTPALSTDAAARAIESREMWACYLTALRMAEAIFTEELVNE